jgi:PAS domain S-box-containing protein
MLSPLLHFTRSAMAAKRQRTTLAVLLLLAVFGVCAGVLFSVDQLAREQREEREITDSLETAQILLAALNQAESSQREFVLTGEQSYFGVYNRAILTVNAQLAAIDRQVTSGVIARSEVSRLEVKARSGLAELSKALEVSRRQEIPALSDSRLILQEWNQEKTAQLANEANLIQQSFSRVRFITATGAGILIVLLLLAAISNEQLIGRLGKAGQESASRERASRELMDSIPDIVLQFSGGGRAEYFNRKWFEYTSFGFEETSGFQWTRALHPEDRERASAAWREAILEERPYEIQYRLRRGADGAYRWHLNRCAPQKDADGRLFRWIATCTDIHDLIAAAAPTAQFDKKVTP